jgi:hypothetical protein
MSKSYNFETEHVFSAIPRGVDSRTQKTIYDDYRSGYHGDGTPYTIQKGVVGYHNGKEYQGRVYGGGRGKLRRSTRTRRHLKKNKRVRQTRRKRTRRHRHSRRRHHR